MSHDCGDEDEGQEEGLQEAEKEGEGEEDEEDIEGIVFKPGRNGEAQLLEDVHLRALGVEGGGRHVEEQEGGVQEEGVQEGDEEG